ncbi:sulfurtransferase [Methylobacterium komagatae]
MKDKFAETFGAAGLGGDETAVIYEASMDTGFGQSCRGWTLLTYLGYPKVKILHGGFSAWTAEGKPVTDEVTAPSPKTFPVDPAAASLFVDLEDMKMAVADPAVVKLDTRDVDEWVGTSSSPYGKDFCPRKGRIPGARWIEWYRMMKPTPAGKMLKAKRKSLPNAPRSASMRTRPWCSDCFKGARASNTLVALKEAGIKDVKLYFGSWNEWSRDPGLPIEEGFPGTKALPLPMAAE